jgi:hypothetical protein
MAVRKKGRSVVEVNGRRFVWWVHDDREVRIASEDKRFVISYHWSDPPKLAVSGPDFPGIERSEKHPVWLAPPAISYRGPAELVPQLAN